MLTDEQREALRTVGNPATLAQSNPALERVVEAIVSEALAARETELREQIAGEIEWLAEWDGAGWPNHAYEIKAAAARIARGDQ